MLNLRKLSNQVFVGFFTSLIVASSINLYVSNGFNKSVKGNKVIESKDVVGDSIYVFAPKPRDVCGGLVVGSLKNSYN
ncbi:MAG: hypothetical protein ACLFN8_04895 [Candidatus Woesearchaeota archaeon]